MAKQTGKRTTKPKTTTRKAPAKRKRRTKKKSSFKKDIIIFLSVLVLIAMVVLGYALGKNDASSDDTLVQSPSFKSQHENRVMLESLEKVKNERASLERKREKEKKQKEEAQREAAKEELLKKMREAKQREAAKAVIYPETITKIEEQKPILMSGKPKLVIIIDDVASSSQLKQIQSLGLKITPSIFPPFKRSPSNHKLAEGLEHYMIHLPMQSGKSYDTHTKTLMVTDSKEVIEERVKEIRALFPEGKYINNHTGSKFTGNYKAMEILYQTLEDEGFVFIDSRTISTTKVPKVAKEHAKRYLARDIFIDNHKSIEYIHKQLTYAVNTAKKRGYAIAIGHPHKTTMKALSQATDIFKDIELVYIDELVKN